MTEKAAMRNTPLARLDLEAIGTAFVTLVPTCLMIGHESIQSTLSYVHGEPGGAATFVKDVLTMTPAEVAERWYGGEKLARLLSAKVMSQALFGPDSAEPA